MGVSDFLRKSARRLRHSGPQTALHAGVQEAAQGSLRRIGEHVYNYGEHVYDREWDVLVVLDTCRWDVLAEVADDYPFLDGYDPKTDTIDSLGSTSPEWIRETFDDPTHESAISETWYVSANPHTDVLNDCGPSLAHTDPVWRYGWDEAKGTVPPRVVTDRAITTARNHDPERMVLHYMQPHQPYRELVERHPSWFSLGRPDGESSTRLDKYVFERLRDGEISHDEMWEAYVDNLRWILDDLRVLLDNLAADTVVITADHGEAFGEYLCYSHQPGLPIPQLKRVPWATTTATDTGSHTPADYETDDRLADEDVTDRLETLGYLG